MNYPLLTKLGVKIEKEPVAHIKRAELIAKLAKHKIDLEKFDEYFGVQTCFIDGPYPWDVEAVLERMINKKLTGTQLFPD